MLGTRSTLIQFKRNFKPPFINTILALVRGISSAASNPASLGTSPSTSIRISKYLAEAGVCSRRQAEKLISDGRITMNGKTMSVSATVTKGDLPFVFVDGAPVHPGRTGKLQSPKLWAIHKLKGELVAGADNKSRSLLLDRFRKHLGIHNVEAKPLYRLDYATEGLCLMTNNGAFSRTINDDDNKIARMYRLRVHGLLTDSKLEGLKKGLVIDGKRQKPVEVTIENQSNTNTWMKVVVYDDKTKIQKLFGALHLKINRMVCIGFGPYRLSDCVPNTSAVFEVKIAPDFHSLFNAAQRKKVLAARKTLVVS